MPVRSPKCAVCEAPVPSNVVSFDTINTPSVNGGPAATGRGSSHRHTELVDTSVPNVQYYKCIDL